MSLASELKRAQEKLAYWMNQVGGVARRWQQYWSDKVAAIFRQSRASATQPGAVKPNAPGAPTAVLVGNAVTITWPAPAANAATVTSFTLYRDGVTPIYTGGTRSATDTLNPSQAAFYKVVAIGSDGTSSDLSAASNTVTAASTPLADTAGPNKPGAPSLLSSVGATPYIISVPVTTDQTVVGHITSGMIGGRYDLKNGGTVLASRPHPSIGAAYVGYPIAPQGATPPTGSDTGSSISSSGDGEHYGASDNFYLSAKDSVGDVPIDITITSITVNPGRLWPKCGVEFRQSSAHDAPYRMLGIVIDDQNQKLLYSEGRTSSGGQATQIILGGGTPTVITLPFRIRETRAHDRYNLEYATNPAAPSWQLLGSSQFSMGDTILSGKFANGCTMGYTLNSHVASSTVTFEKNGNAGDNFNATVVPYDAVLNPGTASDPVNVTVVGTGGGGGGGGGISGRSRGGGYYQGNAARDGLSVIDHFITQDRAVVTLEEQYASVAQTENAIATAGGSCVLVPYEDTMRLTSQSLRDTIVAGKQYVGDDNPAVTIGADRLGNPAFFGGPNGDSYGKTFVLNHASISPLWNNGQGILYNGLSGPVIEGRHRFEYWRKGGGQYATDHAAANPRNRSSMSDDWHITLSQYGIFTPGNTLAAYWRRFGLKAVIAECVRLGLADTDALGNPTPVNYEFWVNISQAYGNADSDPSAISDLQASVHGGVAEGISGPVAGYWWGTGNFRDRIVNNVLSIIKLDGRLIFDAWVPPTSFSDHARVCRNNAAAAWMFDDRGLIGFKINPEQYYGIYRDQFVWRKFLAVDRTTGIGKPLSAGEKIGAWLGERIGSPITGPGPNGLAIAKFDWGTIVKNPIDTGGAQNYYPDRDEARVYCDDEPSHHDGRNVNTGVADLIPYDDTVVYRKR